ncbi:MULTISPECIES: efflux RND transporter periplasmic adaptor subunit [unclassified Stenotrophomonas]|uniref:efflux RND transporter periplasmic adaptor subunit n=1 Tax=unclassified Stenotrophomonas TaxID=196198 RepID=UPI001782A7F6|nr:MULTISPECIES: efflux RND transporter periplasmic adaptor subunit [unclassified Stenotrophomonas]MBD8636483.1 efflux RND transporter periplasmic adaptor subunit [Stenotrophomonas sp. CFBP 13725]MBD8695378.1 efflux RND transporter periplasmic adaptor subunit [Stenotrophomonas sp. CFBP 13718]
MLGRFAMGTAAGLALLMVVGCKGEPEAARRQAADVPVTAQVVEMAAWSDTLQALGTAKARESVTITAKVSEIIEQVHFDSGQQVRAGAPLVTLRGQAQQAALTQAQATFAEADQLYRRQRELAQQRLVASSTLDTQKAIRDSAEARVAEMQSEIGDRNVRAPFAGVLGIRQVSPGSLVTPTTAIATLDDIERMHVDFQVPESELSSLANGNKVEATSVAWPGRTFEGEVTTIDARVDPSTRAVTVRADFANGDHALRPGMLLDVNIYRPERQALIVPEIAVVQVGRESFVYRLKADSTVERADVMTGARRAGVVELKQGIRPGERIIIDGTGKLRPGLKVEAREVAPVAAPEPEKMPPPPATPAPAADAPTAPVTPVAPAGNGG